MTAEEKLRKKLKRWDRWSKLCERLIEKEGDDLEMLFREFLADAEKKTKTALEEIAQQENTIQSNLSHESKEYVRKKYQLERDTTLHRSDIARLDEEIQEFQRKTTHELNRLNEEKTQLKVSLERQLSALRDLYQEKRRHLIVSKTQMINQWQEAESKLKDHREKSQEKITHLQMEAKKKIDQLTEQLVGKKEGWKIALEVMKKEQSALEQEKFLNEKKLSEIHSQKEKELEAARVAIILAKEQLEVDKATLIEKAQDEQRRCESEVAELKNKIDMAEKELQEIMLGQEQKKKDIEEGFLREENILKDTLKTEAEKRDYEQKLFEQEKSNKEKEINTLREEYEKRKWHWDNQIRSLLMQKSVQDSEHEAVRMRVDREARAILRSLEAKRDELKQRLSDLKNRTKVASENAAKENELINQRWHWRRDRLWTLWQNRLDVLKKERMALTDQIENIQKNYDIEKKRLDEMAQRETTRTGEIQNLLVQGEENNKGQQKQREIQFELEKTRLFTQIKECETHISEWLDRLKDVESEVRKNSSGLIQQMGYLDRWYQQEDAETQLFLQQIQGAIVILENLFGGSPSKKANAA